MKTLINFGFEKLLNSSRIIFCFFTGLLIFCLPFASEATHLSGADITYRWISGNTFEFTLTIYRDCSGNAAPNSLQINYSSASCGYNRNATLNAVAGTGQEITSRCSTATTTCSGGSTPGIQMYQYRGNVTLPAQCNDWILGYDICCRNCAITTILNAAGNCNNMPGTYVQSTLNNILAPTNSSPTFGALPMSFVCVGQPFTFHQSAVDPDGDSLVYSLITPRELANTNINFAAGYSSTNPITSSPPISLNASNGNITMNPTNSEVGVLAVLVREFRNGVLIGSIVRDMEIWTQLCTNTPPTATGINGTNNYLIRTCPGRPVSFTINSADVNGSQIVLMNWNNGIPGASFSSSGGSRPTGTFSWTPSAAQASTVPYTFNVTVRDNNCPLNGLQTYTYSIIVQSITATISSTNSLCSTPGSGTATVTASGTAPYTYSWNPGGGNTATINGLVAGTYTVTVTDGGGCTVTASRTITGPPALTGSILASSNVSCNGGQDGSAAVSAAGGTSPYTYSWAPSGGNAASASNLGAGTYNVTITDANNCTRVVPVTITQPTTLVATIINRVNNFCNGNSSGSATGSPTGGTGPFTYSWTPNGATTAANTGLTAGVYRVTITDSRGCTSSASVTITQPPLLNIFTSSVAATCNSSNGSASAIVSGGVGPYTYRWNPGNLSTASITGLVSGSYTVTVTDANGCTATGIVGVSNVGSPTVTVSSITGLTCSGTNSGSASVTVTGGQAPYTYLWSPSGGATNSASGLAAGNYTITVRDDLNCASSIAIVISDPGPLNLNITSTDLLCNGVNTGTASSTVTGGNSPYTYLWTPSGGTSANATGLGNGTYTVRVTDASGCTTTLSTSIAEPAALTVAAGTIVNVSCFGGNNASASITASGGVSPYDYSWSPIGGSLPTATGLTAGNYTVTVTDANGCTETRSVAITQPPNLTTSVTAVAVNCAGGNNGSATVTPSGGTGPFTYQWSPSGGSSATANGLTAGNYTVIVTDSRGCTEQSSTSVSQPSPLNLTALSPANVTCFGARNGSASVSVSGAVSPYTYSWSPSGGSSATATGLGAGNYTVTVRDAHNCSQTALVSVSQPSAIQDSILTQTNVTCFGLNNGAASIDVWDGTPPYSYSWSPSGGSSSSANNLSPGNYTVSITDANGCTETIPVTITQPQAISLTTSSQPSACGGSTGSASVTVSGGRSPYTYLWTPGGNSSASVNGLSGGNYTVRVTDASGCTSTQTVSVSTATGPTVTAGTISPVTCNGLNNGSATVNVSGGNTPYTYQWSPSGGSSSTANNLPAGNYTVTVTDDNNCTQSLQINVPQPATLTSTISASTNISCNGGQNGSATVTPTGGVSPFTYSWSPSGGTGSTASGLSSGNYTVTVSDANHCTTSSSVNIQQPPTLNVSIAATPATCGAANGSLNATVTGGTSAYSYRWMPGNRTGQTISSLGAGTYTLTVTDANGCTSTSSAVVSNVGSPALSLTNVNPVTCFNASNGSASVTATGGTTPYAYQWSPSGGNSNSISGMSAGTYTVTLTDDNQCVSTLSVTISSPPAIQLNMSSTPVTCNGGSNGSASVTATGGAGPYTYSWNGSGTTTSTRSGLATGTYTVTVTDQNGCTSTAQTNVTQPAVLSATISNSNNTSCNGGQNGSATVTPAGGVGPYTYLWTPSGGTASTASGLTAGNYTVRITDNNNCTVTTSVNIQQPQAMTPAISTTPSSCGAANGTANATVTGGSPAYTYRWMPGNRTGSSITGLASGTYTVTITDAGGCAATSSAVVSDLGAAVFSLASLNPVSCFNDNDGSASVTVSGGTAPLTYAWSPSGGNSNSISNVPAGAYTLTVTDDNNCISAYTVTITQPPALQLNMTTTPVSCNGGTNGNVSVVVTGGTAAYSYAWNGSGVTTSNRTGVTAGSYTVTVTDQNGCTSTAQATISQPAAINATIASSVQVSCSGGNNGSATATVNGGTSPFTYSWTPSGGSSLAASGLSAGTYTIRATDAAGCTGSASVTLTQPASLILNASATSGTCGNQNGSASVTVSGGNNPYSYRWNPGGGNTSTINGLAAGTYTVTVTDANNCTSTTSVNVANSGSMTLTTNGVTPASCNGRSDGSALVNVNGGAAPYTYSWSPSGGNAAMASGLSAGNYIVTITDASLCTQAITVVINQPATLNASVSTHVNVSCAGGNNGSANALASGGTSPYAYSWNPGGAATAALGSLTAGTYTVLLTDAHSCTSSAQVTITQPQPILLTASSQPAACGLSNGSASLNVTGGVSPYSYSWSPGGMNTATINGIQAGSYSVVVTDANNCTSTTSVAVSNVNGPVVSIANTNPVTCFGGNDGSGTVSVTGGTAPYTYQWTPTGGSTATGNNLTAGTYSVAVTDDNNCVTAVQVVITQPTRLQLAMSSTPASCNGSANGSATVVASGGSGGYTYLWNGSGVTSATRSGVSAGTYTVTVTDDDGCTSTAQATVTQPVVLNSSISSSNPVSCFGGNNGSASGVASGGTSPFTYRWSPTGGTSSNASGLIAGTYTVTITDASGCTSTSSVTLTQPPQLTISTSSTPTTCGNLNGTVGVSVTGGSSPFTYLWNPGGATSSTVTGLGSGNYSVIATDRNGCTANSSASVINTGTMNAGINNISGVSCNGSRDGSASVLVSGGTNPYTYSWSPSGGNSSTASGLGAGNYTVTVTDDNNCTQTVGVTISQPAVLSNSIVSQVNVSCSGGNNGTVTVSGNGGTGPYTYVWNPGAITGPTLSGLSVGNYNVALTDANGCTASAQISITQPQPITLNSTSQPAGCGLNNGSASVNVNGGVSPYTYSWTPGGMSSANVNNVSAGSYSVTVTDARQCRATTSVAVSNANGPTVSISSTTPVACFAGNNGSATVAVSGGLPPYSYQWSPSGGTSATANNLSSGNYSVAVTDANNCITTIPVVINQPPALQASISATPVTCNGGNNGTVSVNVTGGTGTYTYDWSNSSNTSPNRTGLTAGTYTVTVADGNTCTSTAQVTIVQPTALNTNVTASGRISCAGGSNGTAMVTVSGGTLPYQYHWSPAGGNTSIASGLAAGVYTVTVTDAAGCTSTRSITLTEPPVLLLNSTATPGTCGNPNGTATAVPSGGTSPYTYLWSPGGNTNITATGLGAGNYSVVTTDANGCTSSSSVQVTNSGSMTSNANGVTPVSCFGRQDGSALVNVSGGTAPYSYAWSPSGGTTASASGLAAGNYSVLVTDASQCTQTVLISINQPAVVSVNIATRVNVLCSGGNNGTITAAGNGGTAPYTYVWNPGGTTGPTITSLTAGNYSVVVSDAHSCTSSLQVNITQPSPIALSSTSQPAGCGMSNGSAIVAVSGGTTPYTYAWLPGGMNTASVNAIPAGSYSVVVTDANSCSMSTSVAVSNLNGPTATISSSSQVSCFGGNDGSATVLASNGSAPFTYQWSPAGGTSATANNLTAGNYSVVVRDANNCITTVPVNITEAPSITSMTSAMSTTCPGRSDGSAAVIVSGGTAPYNYSWSSGSTADTALQLQPGVYTVTVSDAHGCSGTASVVVSPSTPISLITTSTPVSCYGGQDGQAMVTATGGTSSYSYDWNSGSTSQFASGLQSGNYTVTVTDLNNCSTTATVFVPEPAAMNIFTSSLPAHCFDSNDGSAIVAVAGGTQPYAYNWSPTGGNSDTASQLVAGPYNVVVTDSRGCSQTQTIQVSSPQNIQMSGNVIGISCTGRTDGAISISPSGGTQPYAYLWNTGDTITTLNNLAAGNYSVSVTDDNGCISTESFSIIAPTVLSVTVDGPQAVCIGQPAVLNAQVSGGTSPFTFSWNNGAQGAEPTVMPVSTTTYTVTATDSNGCTSSAESITVAVNPPLLAAITRADTICPGDQAFIQASASGGNGGPYHYVWSNGSTNDSIVATPEINTDYTVTITDDCGSPPISISTNVVVLPGTNANFLPNPARGCGPLQVQFRNSTTMIPGATSSWSFGDGTTSNGLYPIHIYSEPGTYSVTHTVVNPNGCSAIAVFPTAVQVYPQPIATFNLTPENTSILHPEISFTNLSVNAAIYEWDFGDGSGISIVKNPEHTYTEAGTYEIRLITTSNMGCIDTTYRSVEIRTELTIYIPNTFTPNGDAINDFFKPLVLGSSGFEMFIFDRWGLNIFHSTSIDNPWDGTMDGNAKTPCQMDVYVYLINATDLKGDSHQYIGRVTLFR